jgi:hypothetical protein
MTPRMFCPVDPTRRTFNQATGRQRPLPDATDYVGNGRVAACCTRRRYNLRPDADEMNELINHP